MSSVGLVYLYDSDSNTPISIRKYSDKTKRRRIIDGWRRKYAHGFYRCFIVISPELPEDCDYDLIEQQLDNAMKPTKKSKFERPKAEYKGIYNVEKRYNY